MKLVLAAWSVALLVACSGGSPTGAVDAAGEVACAQPDAPCTDPGQCCSNQCEAGRCATASGCSINGTACAGAGDCCSQRCEGGSCQPAAGCQAEGGSCDAPGDCCSGRCASGMCIAGPGTCDAVAEPCTVDGNCCSGRCEPVPGGQNQACLGVCFATGAACTRALDCCSLGCFGGVCTNQLCVVEGQTCAADSDCCSNSCGADHRCKVDLTPGCRPTGESCSSGGSTHCCSEVCDPDSHRCDFAPDTCVALGGPCDVTADCCSGQCSGGTCTPVCNPVGGACTSDASCCDGNCDPVSMTCRPPVGTCVPAGGACTTDAACCHDLCIGGACTILIP